MKSLKRDIQLELTKNGALILDRSLLNYDQFLQLANNKNCNIAAYDNGLTSCFYNKYESLIISYCEGDTVEIHCKTQSIFDSELKDHVDYFNENEA